MVFIQVSIFFVEHNSCFCLNFRGTRGLMDYKIMNSYVKKKLLTYNHTIYNVSSILQIIQKNVKNVKKTNLIKKPVTFNCLLSDLTLHLYEYCTVKNKHFICSRCIGNKDKKNQKQTSTSDQLKGVKKVPSMKIRYLIRSN